MGRGWPIAAEIDGSHVTASAGEEDEGSHDERSRVLRIDLGHTLGRIHPFSRLAGVMCTVHVAIKILKNVVYPWIPRDLPRDSQILKRLYMYLVLYLYCIS